MISDVRVAKRVSDLMLEVGDRLNESIADVMKNCSDEEFRKYRRSVGAVMGELLLQVLNPLYDEHPSLKPLNFD